MSLEIQELPSCNCDERLSGVDMLVLHYTGMQTANEAVARLRDPAARVSSHYVVDEDGVVLRLVPEALRAWHAGLSYWRGRTALNDVSIGIEIVNPGHEWGYRAYPAVQIEAVCRLCLEILQRWPIAGCNVVAHSDIAPNRKQDPGELFPWQTLARRGIGIWPESASADDEDAWILLGKIGYDTQTISADNIIAAFQRHWRPQFVSGAMDAGTRKRVLQVARAFRHFDQAAQ